MKDTTPNSDAGIMSLGAITPNNNRGVFHKLKDVL